MNNERVCFGAKNDSFGSFNVLHNGAILTFKLVYKSGYVTCNSKNLPYGSHWACNNRERIGTIITNGANKVIFPHNYKNTSFTLPSYHCNSSRLIYHLSPQMVDGGEEFRIWYHEDYRIRMKMIMLVIRVLMCMLCTTNFRGDISFDACTLLIQ